MPIFEDDLSLYREPFPRRDEIPSQDIEPHTIYTYRYYTCRQDGSQRNKGNESILALSRGRHFEVAICYAMQKTLEHGHISVTTCIIYYR